MNKSVSERLKVSRVTLCDAGGVTINAMLVNFPVTQHYRKYLPPQRGRKSPAC